MKKIIWLILSISLVLIACQTPIESDNTSFVSFDDIFVPVFSTGNDSEYEEISEDRIAYSVEIKEGELINLTPVVLDPDGDIVSLKFSAPLNELGRWQTKIGDAGVYIVKVEASDDEFTVIEYMRLTILPTNRAPTITGLDVIEVLEGEELKLNFTIIDEENDTFTTEISGFMNSSFKELSFEDAYPNGCEEKGCVAEQIVKIAASDSYQTEIKEVLIKITDVNREPIIEIEDITATEGDFITLDYEVTDPDGDSLLVTIEGISEDGWNTSKGDAGEYSILLKVFDGVSTIEKNISLDLKPQNNLPVLELTETITVLEGETIELEINASDEDGDSVIISFEGWMNSSRKETTLEDAAPNGCEEEGCNASYEVKVLATDGKDVVEKIVTITVVDKPSTIFLSGFAIMPEEPKSTDDVLAYITYEDEEDLSGIVFFNWLINDISVKEENISVYSGDMINTSLSADNYLKDDLLTVKVYAQNDLFNSEELALSVTILNSPPVFVFP